MALREPGPTCCGGQGAAMAAFDRIVVIFNPHSTGDAAALAEQLDAELTARLADTPVTLSPTEHAGHAQDLAPYAARTGRPLIVSVSGDGGYDEVIDGAVAAGNPAAICAVLAAGNANDHARTVQEQPLVEAIVAGKTRGRCRASCAGEEHVPVGCVGPGTSSVSQPAQQGGRVRSPSNCSTPAAGAVATASVVLRVGWSGHGLSSSPHARW